MTTIIISCGQTVMKPGLRVSVRSPLSWLHSFTSFQTVSTHVKKKSSKLKKTNKNKNAVCCYYIQSTSWTSFNKHVFPDGCQTVLNPTEQILKKTLFVSFTGKKVASQLQGRMLKRRQKLVSLLLNWTEINQGEKQGGNCVRKRKRKKKLEMKVNFKRDNKTAMSNRKN